MVQAPQRAPPAADQKIGGGLQLSHDIVILIKKYHMNG
jgi:hypothetical protein